MEEDQDPDHGPEDDLHQEERCIRDRSHNPMRQYNRRLGKSCFFLRRCSESIHDIMYHGEIILYSVSIVRVM